MQTACLWYLKQASFNFCFDLRKLIVSFIRTVQALTNLLNRLSVSLKRRCHNEICPVCFCLPRSPFPLVLYGLKDNQSEFSIISRETTCRRSCAGCAFVQSICSFCRSRTRSGYKIKTVTQNQLCWLHLPSDSNVSKEESHEYCRRWRRMKIF